MKANRLQSLPWLAQETLGKPRNIGSEWVVHGEGQRPSCLKNR